MLSISQGFLFIHIPKTGGNSIQNVLRKYSDDEIACIAPHQDGLERFEVRSARYKTHKHSTLADYRSEYGLELFSRLLKIACIRNPWDRAVSFFFSPHRGEVRWDPEEFLRFIPQVHPVKHYLSLDTDRFPDLESAIRNIDCLLRFESLQEDFNALCTRLAIPAETLPRRNCSRRRDFRSYFDAHSFELVKEQFAEEIELFDFHF